MDAMITDVFLLDVFWLDGHSPRLVTRCADMDTFALVSLGTGECVYEGNAEGIVFYLNKGNPQRAQFTFCNNLAGILTPDKRYARIAIK